MTMETEHIKYVGPRWAVLRVKFIVSMCTLVNWKIKHKQTQCLIKELIE